MIDTHFIHNVGNMFSGQQKGLTWQQVRFYFMLPFGCDRYNYITEEKNRIKEKFLCWQAKENPFLGMSKLKSDKLNSIGITFPFSHDNDMTWNSLDEWFVIAEKNYQEYQIEQKKLEQFVVTDDEFPF
jgi:hypothetical protein